ncbi:hypothetical protein E8E12_009379 [Didymella heteroderae]|uniref:Probable pectate lyase F n=1 Tax=Didymella heteroderae TaxID=1769908 RepID=A0A9P5C1U3_9PLEO|nr:hypothetical protein E8E12_009379 [Didymella heteroderae]
MKFTQVQLAALVASIASAQTLDIPTRVGEITSLPSPSIITGSVDLGNKEFDRGQPCDSDEDTGSDNAVFILEDGASLSNVIIGADALEGVHCTGSCTLTNVWFRDVCEDAISVLGTGDATIIGGGAQEAKDKVVQHNGAGTVTIKDFTVVNAGKLYRSCGDCTNNEAKSPRKVVVENVRAYGMTSDLIGINSNFGDEATISGSCGVTKNVCQEYKGVNKGSGSSSKVDSKTACKGAQGQLESLPACGADSELPAPETPSASEGVPSATVTASEVEPTPTATVTASEVEPTYTATITASEVEPTYTATVTASEVEPTYTATVSATATEVDEEEEEEATATSAVPTTLETKTKTKSEEPAPTKDTSSGSVARWGQCGGKGYTGPTECAAGECKVQNDWYSQCL